MAGNYQFGLAWQTYTATASAAATNHPGSNVALVKQPRKTWKDSGTGTGATIVCDQGGGVTLGAVFLNGGTVASWTVEQSSSAGSGYSALAASPLTVAADVRVGNRRKGLFLISSTLRYLRFTVASLISGATVAELGALALVPAASLITMTRNFGRPEYRPVVPETLLEFDGGPFDVNDDGDPYVEYVLAHPTLVLSGGTLDQVHAIRNARDVILYENFDNTAHAYLGHVTDMDPVPRAFRVTSATLRFREYA